MVVGGGGGENLTILKQIFKFIDEMIIIIQIRGVLLEHIQNVSQLKVTSRPSIIGCLFCRVGVDTCSFRLCFLLSYCLLK